MEAACMLMDLLYIIIIYCKQFHTCSFKTWNYVFSSLKTGNFPHNKSNAVFENSHKFKSK